MKTVHKVTMVCSGILFFACSALVAGKVHFLLQHGSRLLKLTDSAPLEYFVENKSFSEIENARSLLQGLATQVVTELRVQRDLQTDGSIEKSQALQQTLKQVEKAKEDFAGTPGELLMVTEQLILLSVARLNDQWLDLYLQTLYQHPTSDLVGREAKRAILLGKRTGREDEVLRAFEHIGSIPLEFPSKMQVVELLPRQGIAQVKLNGSPEEVM
jgi:hypothetical protein